MLSNPNQDQVNTLCSNIGKALSIIYSNRINADVKITCIPVKITDEGEETKNDRAERVS